MTYKNKKPLSILKNKVFSQDKLRDSSLVCSMHTGTHVDAPAHFLSQGKTVDGIDLLSINGSCRVLDLTSCKEHITAEELEPFQIQKGERILLKTRNSNQKPNETFNFTFVFLTKSGAEYLAERGVIAVGIDALGIERNQEGHPTHKILFENEVTIIEGLRLAQVEEGEYKLSCLPLNIIGAEAAPARALLQKKR